MSDTFYKKLPNGLQIVHRNSTSEVAYIGIMIGVGTRDEQATENGLAHYIEHCVFKGMSDNGHTYSAQDIIDRIEGVGGEVNAYTTKEETTYYIATPAKHWRKSLQLLHGMVTGPTFPKKETDKEVEVILDEISSYEDSPSELIYDDFEELVFQGHPLSMPILGTPKSVRNISKKASTAARFIAAHYRPERMVVFSQGKITADAVFKETEKLFGDDRQTATLPMTDQRQEPHTYRPADRSYKKHTHQIHVMLGGRAYPIGHPKQLALYMLNNILGGGSMNSRLNLNLREKKGLVYTIESQYTPLSDSGYWSVYFASDEKDKDECIRLIKKQLQLLRDKPLTPRQMQKALTQLHGQMAISAENQENNVFAMAKLMLYHGFAPTWEETFRHIAQLTPDILQTVAREIYAENNISTLTYN